MDANVAVFLQESTNEESKMVFFLIPVNLEIKTSSAAPISGSLEAQ